MRSEVFEKWVNRIVLAPFGCMAFFFLLVLSAFVVSCLTGGIPYSEGYRDGSIQKFSRHGLVWSLDEGELAQDGFKSRGRSEENVFRFTVRDGAVADAVRKTSSAKRVRLHYRQSVLCPPWVSSTGYVVHRLEVLE